MASEEKLKPKPHPHQNASSWLSLDRGIHIGVIVIGLLDIVIAVIGAIKHGLAALLKPLVVMIGLALWLACFRVWTARDPGLVSEAKTPKHSPKKRRWALIIMIVIPLIPVGCYVASLIPSKEFIILVADFDGPDPEHYRVTEILLQELRQGLEKEKNLRIESLGEIVTERLGSGHAQKLGERRHAAMLLWGWYAANEENVLVTVHVDLLRGPKLTVLERTNKSFNGVLSELRSFKIQFKLGREMSSLTMLLLGTQEMETGDFNRAIAHLSSAISQQSNPDQIVAPESAYLLRSRAYFGAAQFGKALEDLDRALVMNANFYTAWNNRCAIHSLEGEFNEALKECNRAIELDDPCCRADAYANRGRVSFYQGQTGVAIEDYNRAIKIQPTFDIAYNLRGEAYRELGQVSRALDDFANAIRLRRNYPNPYNNRGILYAKNLKDYDRAIGDFNQALKYRPNYPEAYNNRGHTYLLAGDFSHAVSDLRKAIEIVPDYYEAHEGLGEAYLFSLNKQGAIAEFRRAGQLTTDTTKQRTLAEIVAELESEDLILSPEIVRRLQAAIQ